MTMNKIIGHVALTLIKKDNKLTLLVTPGTVLYWTVPII